MSFIDDLLNGASTNDNATPDTSLTGDVSAPVGPMFAPSPRVVPTAVAYPQFQPSAPVASLLQPKPGDWHDTLIKSLIAGLGGFAAARAHVDPSRILDSAQHEVDLNDADRYKLQLLNARQAQAQQSDADRRRMADAQHAQQRLSLLNDLSKHIDTLTTPEEVARYKAMVHDYYLPFGIDTDTLPTLPSTGSLMKIRKQAQDTLKGFAQTLKDTGKDPTDASLWDPNNPNAPTFQLVPGGPAIKSYDLLKIATGGEYDPSQFKPLNDDKFTGRERARADARAQQLYGPKADYTALKDKDWTQMAHEDAEARHIALTVNNGGAQPSDIESNAQLMVDGNLLLSQLSKKAGTYNATIALANRLSLKQTGKPINFVKQEADFRAALKWASTVNGPQRQTFNALADSVVNTIGEVQALGDELQQGGLQKWNQAKRSSIMQVYGNTPQSGAAVRYMGAINTLKEEFAQLASGGYAPTEPAWKLADEQINGDFGTRDLHSSLTEVKRLINYRVQAFDHVRPRSAYDEAPASPLGPETHEAPAPGTGAKPPRYAPGKVLTLKDGSHVKVIGVNPDGSYATMPAP